MCDPVDGKLKPIYPTVCFLVFLGFHLKSVSSFENGSVVLLAKMTMDPAAHPDIAKSYNDWEARFNAAEANYNERLVLELAQERMRYVASEGPGAPPAQRLFYSFCRREWVRDHDLGMHCRPGNDCTGCLRWYCLACCRCNCDKDDKCKGCMRIKKGVWANSVEAG